MRLKSIASLVVGLTLVMVNLPGVRAVGQAGSALTIPTAQLIQADELSRVLSAPDGDKPLVLQVGSHVLFAESHIKGSEYVGPGGQDAGLKLLKDRVEKLPRSTYIVVYCGCCPWNRCPNIAAAYKELGEMGFTHVKALYLANNFGTDWESKGYAVDKGQ